MIPNDGIFVYLRTCKFLHVLESISIHRNIILLEKDRRIGIRLALQ